MDVVVDLRSESENFGSWEAVALNADDRNALLIPRGFGHSFMALTDPCLVAYLCTDPYRPEFEFSINALDESLDIPWPADLGLIQSDRDRSAPTLASLLRTDPALFVLD